MKTRKKLEVPAAKVRHLRPSNRDRVIRTLKGGGYRRRARTSRGEE